MNKQEKERGHDLRESARARERKREREAPFLEVGVGLE